MNEIILTAVISCVIRSQVDNALQTIWFSIKIGLSPFRGRMDTSQRFHHTGGVQLCKHVGEWNSFAIAAALWTLQTQSYDITQFLSVYKKKMVDVVF